MKKYAIFSARSGANSILNSDAQQGNLLTLPMSHGTLLLAAAGVIALLAYGIDFLLLQLDDLASPGR